MPRADGGADRALVFGDLIDDIIVTPRGPIRPDTDTSSTIRSRPGGSAANTTAWMAAAGADVCFVGRCGAVDVDRHAAFLRAAGVDPHIAADTELPTGAIVVIVQGHERTMLTERGANARLSPDDVDVAGCALVHAVGYTLVEHAAAFRALVERAHAAGARVSLNAGSVAAIDELGVDAFAAASAGVDILIATDAEAALLTGLPTADAAAGALARRHGVAAVTLGHDGVQVAARDGLAAHVAAQLVTAIDPTGAGDAFTAGLLAALLRGADPITAATEGAALAAQAVTVVGGRPV